jgi:hypothetical protein
MERIRAGRISHVRDGPFPEDSSCSKCLNLGAIADHF